MAKAQEVELLGKVYSSRSQACKAYGHSPAKIDHRMRKGVSLEQAILDADRYQGKKLHKSYGSWNGMRSRCYSSSACSKLYKKKNIQICDRWKDNFWAFVEDMGEPPAEGMSLDRIDNDGDYTPENCRWATRAEQQRNMSSNTPITIFNETRLLIEWTELSGLLPQTIAERIRRGIPPELAVTTNTREGRISMITLINNRLIYNKILAEKENK